MAQHRRVYLLSVFSFIAAMINVESTFLDPQHELGATGHVEIGLNKFCGCMYGQLAKA